jgi:LAO/AO transport system kinase
MFMGALYQPDRAARCDKFRRLSTLSDRILEGDARAIARGISLIEDDPKSGADLVRDVFGRTGRAFLVGITGAPGAGKSTLVDALVTRWRKTGMQVGVIAVDPTSPYTGGAMLGDRVRMQTHASDSGVFIRSMATRGHLGGLSRATADAAIILDAAGKDIVAIETVGVGQDEVDIVRAADAAVLVLVPGMGDEVQALKAGIMEIADIFVVNKADRDGADRTVAEVESLLSLQAFAPVDWKPPIVRTVGTTGAGIDELLKEIERFRAHAGATLATRRRTRAATQLRAILADRFMARIDREVAAADMDELIERVVARETDPYSAADDILRRAETGGGVR